MHPMVLGDVAHDHIRSLIEEADVARLARTAGSGRTHGLRRRFGLTLIAAGNRLAREHPRNVVPLHGGRV